MNIFKRHLLLLMVLLSFCVYADETDLKGNVDVSAFQYLNDLRAQAGMQAFAENPKLDEAALNHASYCYNNRVVGHFESKGHPGYTGYDHIERINFVGYISRSTGENVSSHTGSVDDKASVDGLMSAIYHRFIFLSFDYDEIGIGKVMQGDTSCYVYNLGSVLKNELCLKETSKVKGAYYDSVCRNRDFRINVKDYDAVSARAQKKNAYVALWPADNSNDVPPAFFEESPDPLPSFGVSGYPVSIQFNPSVFPVAPQVTRFELFDKRTGESLEIIKYMNKNTDHNKKFKDYEHAIFPLKRLQWAGEYRAEVDFSVKRNSKTIKWSFNTRELVSPTYVLTKDKQVIKEKSGHLFTVYLPPRHANDAEKSYKTRYSGLSSLDIKVLDGNTLLISAEGRGEADITFHGIVFKVVI